mmetsp:Transcript_2636/g.7857  ORF Transcript_2636/g.7857 Transcript_2636/m.7857 type:complete len:143 (+) Transcript_2636:287-715(+)
MAAPILSLVIVGHEDHPIFEVDLGSRTAEPSTRDERAQYLHQFVLHASLDAVEEQLWTTPAMHLGTVDRFNNLQVSAYVTAAHIKFLLLHDGRSDDTIRSFFRDVYECYLRVIMNPFITPTTRITSALFQSKIRGAARNYFR